ncbi:MAG: response regulator [Magnetococcales bacterium]|nr:response regulator [Magnetococcales bacterium]
MKILIVDDILENRKLLQDLLKPYGSCDMAADGVEALTFVEAAIDEEEPYDLILLDVMMPRMDGQLALEKIRTLEQERGLSGAGESIIFMVTANDSPRQAASAFFKGYCTDYLMKPVMRQVLLDKMREYRLIAD